MCTRTSSINLQFLSVRQDRADNVLCAYLTKKLLSGRERSSASKREREFGVILMLYYLISLCIYL